MNFCRKRRYEQELRAFENGLQRKTYRVRIDFPGFYYRFGEASEEIPRYLSGKFSEHELVDYINLVRMPEAGHQSICLDENDCMYLAKLLTQFRESPLSTFRRRAWHMLADAFEKDTEERQAEILREYFGPNELDKLSSGELPSYYRLSDLFRNELIMATMDLVLTILSKEYNKSIFDLEVYLWSYDEVMQPRIVNGIPSLVMESGKIYDVLLKDNENKILVLNSHYHDPGSYFNGPGSYICSTEPSVTVLTQEEFRSACGYIDQRL